MKIIKLEQCHIDNGQPRRSDGCPFALAISEQFAPCHIGWQADKMESLEKNLQESADMYAFFDDGQGGWQRVCLPRSVTHAIISMDVANDKRSLRSCEFELEVSR